MDTPALFLIVALVNLFIFGLLLGSDTRGISLWLPLFLGAVFLLLSAVALNKSQQEDTEQRLVDTAARISSMQHESWQEGGEYLASEAALQRADHGLGKVLVGEDFFIEKSEDTLVFEVGRDDQSLRVQIEDGEVVSVSSKEIDESRWQWPDDLQD